MTTGEPLLPWLAVPSIKNTPLPAFWAIMPKRTIGWFRSSSVPSARGYPGDQHTLSLDQRRAVVKDVEWNRQVLDLAVFPGPMDRDEDGNIVRGVNVQDATSRPMESGRGIETRVQGLVEFGGRLDKVMAGDPDDSRPRHLRPTDKKAAADGLPIIGTITRQLTTNTDLTKLEAAPSAPKNVIASG